MKLDKESRNFLDKLIASESDFSMGVFTYEHIVDTFKMDEADMYRVVRGLKDRGLLDVATWNGDIDFGVILSQKGKTYKELNRLDARERWRERLWGFITGAALVALAWWLTSL